MASLSETVREWLLAPLTARLTHLEASMADTSALLTEVAAGLNGPLFTSVQALIASEREAREAKAQAEAELAVERGEADTLRAEDVAESAAASDVRDAFGKVAGLFNAPEVPDVTPLPEPEQPTDTPAGEDTAPVTDGGTVTEAPADVPAESPTDTAPAPDASVDGTVGNPDVANGAQPVI